MIPFSKATYVGNELKYVEEAVVSRNISGDGAFTKKCNRWFEERFDVNKVLFTTSCTHALEMAAYLCKIKPGDEVIMPSFTFASTADAFALRGAKIVFVDIRPDTMNIDETKIEQAITDKTKVIVPVHYAGVACEMDTIMDIARRHHLLVVEDAAQGITSTYKGKYLGTIGDFGCFSFHETKNFCMGEGGALAFQNADYIEKAEILREKGTNRSKFWRGEIDKYTWVDLGSSYLPSELNMAYLWGQFEMADEIQNQRMERWYQYYDGLKDLMMRGFIELPQIPKGCVHNAHVFYIKLQDELVRSQLIKWLKDNGINATFHYIPLHTVPAGKKYGRFVGRDQYTTVESERLLRLPLYYGLKKDEVEVILGCIRDYFERLNRYSLCGREMENRKHEN